MRAMPRATRQRWQEASTLRELGELTALWLEGKLDSQPGYVPRVGPDKETTELVPLLARLNRIGYLTDSSQPGWGPAPGYDGAIWCQRAAVSGFADAALADTITQVATKAGMLVSAANVRGPRWDPDAITVTTRADRPYTAFGGSRTASDLAFSYDECCDAGINAVCAAVQLAVVDPEWGERDALWSLLDSFVAYAARRTTAARSR